MYTKVADENISEPVSLIRTDEKVLHSRRQFIALLQGAPSGQRLAGHVSGHEGLHGDLVNRGHSHHSGRQQIAWAEDHDCAHAIQENRDQGVRASDV